MSDWSNPKRPDSRPGDAASQRPAAKLPATPPRKPGRSGRLTTSMVGLSAAAIASVYAVGYLRTSGASDSFAATVDATATVGALPTSPSVARQIPTASVDGRSTGRVAPTATPAPASSQALVAYNDGSYTGTGNSRHGGMEVTVVIKDQKIVSAAVSQCGTRYSCDKVDTLTRLTVSRQTVPVDHVSGATDSSNAYKQAVAAALAKARAS